MRRRMQHAVWHMPHVAAWMPAFATIQMTALDLLKYIFFFQSDWLRDCPNVAILSSKLLQDVVCTCVCVLVTYAPYRNVNWTDNSCLLRRFLRILWDFNGQQI